MPKATVTTLTEKYVSLRAFEGAEALGEKTAGKAADCGVIALASAAGITYEEAHAALAKEGRKAGAPTANEQLKAALEGLGFIVSVFANPSRITEDFPGIHKNLKNVTTHTPRRFKSAWDKHFAADANLFLFSKEHVSSYNEGLLQDWAINNSRRVHEIWEITKPAIPQIEQPEAPADEAPAETPAPEAPAETPEAVPAPLAAKAKKRR